MSTTPKIFQIGFNKCGTRSLNAFFTKNNIASVHYKRGQLAETMADNIAHARDPLTGIEGWTAYTDVQSVTGKRVIEGAKFYKELFAAYPDAYFILNTRDREDWIKSRVNHGAGHYPSRYMRGMKLPDIESVLEYWRTEWDRHHQQVPAFFERHKGRLLVFDIANDDPAKLSEFLAPDFTTDPAHLGHEGNTKDVDITKYQRR